MLIITEKRTGLKKQEKTGTLGQQNVESLNMKGTKRTGKYIFSH